MSHRKNDQGTSLCRSQRHAFTLVELLVVIAIIGILVAITLPAINQVRTTARANTCRSNLRQIAIGVTSQAMARDGKLPAQWRTANPMPWENFSWAVDVLPELDNGNVRDGLDLEQLPFSERNQAISSISISIFECPATPGSPRNITRLKMAGGGAELTGISAGARDYVAVHDVLFPGSTQPQRGVWRGGHSGTEFDHRAQFNDSEAPAVPDGDPNDLAMAGNSFDANARTIRASLANVPDGLTSTVLLVEQSGRPDAYSDGVFRAGGAGPSGTWATGDMAIFGDANIQKGNQSAPFSFHSGATVAMCDGSVHSWPASMDANVMRALLTADGNEIVDDDDWK